MEIIMVKELVKGTLDYIYERIDINALDNIYFSYLNEDKKYRHEMTNLLLDSFKEILKACEGEELYYYIKSFLIHATNSLEVYKDFINVCIRDCNLTKENKYCLYLHASEMTFLGIVQGDEESGMLLDDLYRQVIEEFRNSINVSYNFIEEKDRNHDLIIVMTCQMLELMHGPTKTLLDRCSVIKNTMKKNVLIINTAEKTRINGFVDVFNARQGRYMYEYCHKDTIEFKGETFPIIQCPDNMPDSSVIEQLVGGIAEYKPYCIVSIGGDSIVNDLCSKIVPTITISTVPSSRTQTYGQFQAIGKKISDEDMRWAKKII